MFSVLVKRVWRSYHGCRCETGQQSAWGWGWQTRGTPPQRRQVSAVQQTGWSTKNHNKYFRNTPILKMCTPTSFYSSNPVQQVHWGTQAYMFTCTLIFTGLYQHVTNQGYRWTRWSPRVCGHTGCMCVHVAVAFSWSRRRRAAQRPQAPCRRGRWRTSSASRLYSPRDRCACRAGTGWGLHKQSPSYKWHICAEEHRRSSP